MVGLSLGWQLRELFQLGAQRGTTRVEPFALELDLQSVAPQLRLTCFEPLLPFC